MAFHYYQMNDGEITAMSESEQEGFTYSEEELVKDYKGSIVFESALDDPDYESRKEEYEKELLKDDLRFRRETECFAIINRGRLWYELLTESQKEELRNWYSSWLDVTETLQVPEKPSWLS